MSDPLQSLPPPIASEPAVDRTMLDRIILRPSPDVQGTSMKGETVLLDLSTGHSTISGIHAVLCDCFEVASERALDDLVTLVNQLIQEGLLQQERG